MSLLNSEKRNGDMTIKKRLFSYKKISLSATFRVQY